MAFATDIKMNCSSIEDIKRHWSEGKTKQIVVKTEHGDGSSSRRFAVGLENTNEIRGQNIFCINILQDMQYTNFNIHLIVSSCLIV